MSNKTQTIESSRSTSQGDSAKDRQLELEIRAFAEVLLDIYEYQCQQKRKKTDPQPHI